MHHSLILVLLLALLLFVFLPWQFALPLYVPILSIIVYSYWKIRQAQRQRPVVGEQSMIGDRALVVSSSREQIEVHYRGETWRAVSSQPVHRGQRVIIEGVEGLTLRVAPLDEKADSARKAA
jgi:membrane-bound serine protease (ClpP class)